MFGGLNLRTSIGGLEDWDWRIGDPPGWEGPHICVLHERNKPYTYMISLSNVLVVFEHFYTFIRQLNRASPLRSGLDQRFLDCSWTTMSIESIVKPSSLIQFKKTTFLLKPLFGPQTVALIERWSSLDYAGFTILGCKQGSPRLLDSNGSNWPGLKGG